MSFAEDQHPVGDLGPGGEHEPFCLSVRARTSRRDLHGLDAGVGQGRIERRSELPSPVTDQEPEARGAVTEIHQEIADLLGCPRPVRVRGHPEDVYVTGTDLHDEQAVQTPEGHCAVHVKVPGRVHLDVRLDVDGDLDRLIALGATRQWQDPKGGWSVLADPEGNLFCAMYPAT